MQKNPRFVTSSEVFSARTISNRGAVAWNIFYLPLFVTLVHMVSPRFQYRLEFTHEIVVALGALFKKNWWEWIFRYRSKRMLLTKIQIYFWHRLVVVQEYTSFPFCDFCILWIKNCPYFSYFIGLKFYHISGLLDFKNCMSEKIVLRTVVFSK